MKPRVDESDADTPQDATPPNLGAPAKREPTALDELFGRLSDHSSRPEAAVTDAAARERLARFFARDPEVASTAEPTPAVPSAVAADVEPPAVAAVAVDVEPAAVDVAPAAAVVETGGDVEPPVLEDAAPALGAADADPWAADVEFDELAYLATLTEEPSTDDAESDEWAYLAALAGEPEASTGTGEAAIEEAPAGTTDVEPEPDAVAALAVSGSAADPLALGWLSDPAVPASPEPHPSNGTFAPARPHRGVRGTLFGSRWRTAISVLASIVLVAGLVAGTAIVAQTLAANAALAQAQADLEAAEDSIDKPATDLTVAETRYEETLLAARAAADSAAPSLAGVAGMADQALLDAANAALAALVAALDQPAPSAPPAPYERGDIETSDIDDVTAAAEAARAYSTDVSLTAIDFETAESGLVTAREALTAAQHALGASLPATAATIAGENALAEQSFRDAVIVSADAVVAAQAAGGSGDAELLAYAAAVTALRADQERAVEEASRTVTRPRSGTTNPTPTPTPTPTPEPTPEPEPTPTPTPTP